MRSGLNYKTLITVREAIIIIFIIEHSLKQALHNADWSLDHNIHDTVQYAQLHCHKQYILQVYKLYITDLSSCFVEMFC